MATNLLHADIETLAKSLNVIFVGAVDTNLDATPTSVLITTGGNARQDIFVADTVLQSEVTFQNPFCQGEIQVIAHLEGVEFSTVISVPLGTDIHYVNTNGTFHFDTQPGIEDIAIQVPGHLSVSVPEALINAGGLITLPELTLPFGDANGDGE